MLKAVTLLLVIFTTASVGMSSYAFAASSTDAAAVIPSPVEQVANGVAAVDVVCKDHLVLMLRGDGSPVCVTQASSERLASMGIAVLVPPQSQDPPHLISLVNDLLDAEMYAVSGEHYAVMISFSNSSVMTLDISSQEVLDVARVGVGGFDSLNGPEDIEIFQSGEMWYAMVAAYLDDAVMIMDITDPTDIVPVATIDSTGGFDALGGARDIAVHQSPDGTYAYVTSVIDDAIQIVNVTDATRPTPAGIVEDRTLASTPLHANVFEVHGKPYLLVTGNGEVAAQILDISDPANPVRAGIIMDDHVAFSALSGAMDTKKFETPSGVFLMVTRAYESLVFMLDIANPADPAIVSVIADGEGGFDSLGGARDIEIFQMDDKIYAMVASQTDHAVQVMEITDPFNPVPVYVIPEGYDMFDLTYHLDVEIVPSADLALLIGAGGDLFQTYGFKNPLDIQMVGSWMLPAESAP